VREAAKECLARRGALVLPCFILLGAVALDLCRMTFGVRRLFRPPSGFSLST
jgi:hypothetical protein